MMVKGFSYAIMSLEEAYNKSLQLLYNIYNNGDNKDPLGAPNTEKQSSPSNKIIVTSPVLIKRNFKDEKSELANQKYQNIPEIKKNVQTANSYYATSRNYECIEIWDLIISKYPEFSIAYYNRGLAKKWSGDLSSAKADFDKASALGLIVD